MADPASAATAPAADPSWIERQRRFYDTRPHAHLRYAPDSRYAVNLVQHLVEAAGLPKGARILEVGCGAGRFTIPLLERLDGEVVGFDLSASLLEELRQALSRRDRAAAGRLRVVAGDVYRMEAADVGGGFDAIVGFFVLHHLPDIAGALAGLRRLLRPGGRMVFIEPNRRNPLFLLQVLCCPDMSWSEERGMFTLGRRRLREAFRAAGGLCEPSIGTFGWFPPQILDRWAWALRLEERLERVPLLRPVLPFRLIRSQAA